MSREIIKKVVKECPISLKNGRRGACTSHVSGSSSTYVSLTFREFRVRDGSAFDNGFIEGKAHMSKCKAKVHDLLDSRQALETLDAHESIRQQSKSGVTVSMVTGSSGCDLAGSTMLVDAGMDSDSLDDAGRGMLAVVQL